MITAVLTILLLSLLSWIAFKAYNVYKLYLLKNKTNAYGPGAIESIRNIIKIGEFDHDWIMNNNYTKPFLVRFFGLRLDMLAATPDAAQFVLSKKELFPKHFDSIGTASSGQLFTNNIVSAEGADWRRFRTLYSPAFGQEAYKGYFPIFEDFTEKVLNMIESQSKQDINMSPLLSKFTIDVLGKAIFDYNFNSLDNELDKYYSAYKNIISQTINLLFLFFPWVENIPLSYTTQVTRDVDIMIEMVNSIVAKRKQEQGKHDILSHFIQAAEANDKGLTEKEMISNIFVLFVAGHETTATALTYLLHELMKNPHIQQKLYEEINEKIGDRKPTMEDLESLTYLENTISESLRKRPPVASITTRIAAKDISFEDVFIPEGTSIGLDILHIQNSPKYWDKPEEFNPDRFLPENKKKMHRYQYLPFSLGPRQCIGNNFSLIEQHLFITRFIQRFEILPPKEHSTILEKTNPLNLSAAWFTIKSRK